MRKLFSFDGCDRDEACQRLWDVFAASAITDVMKWVSKVSFVFH